MMVYFEMNLVGYPLMNYLSTLQPTKNNMSSTKIIISFSL